MKRIPDMLVEARREGPDGLFVQFAAVREKTVAALYFHTEGGVPFDDDYFEDAKQDIAEVVVSKFMNDTGKKFHELDIVVAFHAPEFDNLELDFVDPEEDSPTNTETTEP